MQKTPKVVSKPCVTTVVKTIIKNIARDEIHSPLVEALFHVKYMRTRDCLESWDEILATEKVRKMLIKNLMQLIKSDKRTN